jgi:hypothetical protein
LQERRNAMQQRRCSCWVQVFHDSFHVLVPR